MELTREPLRLTTVVREELEDFEVSPLRLITEDGALAPSPLRLLDEARRRGGGGGSASLLPGASFARGRARAQAALAQQGSPVAPTGSPGSPVASGPGFFARAISGYKGQQSGQGTMAHHLGQWMKSRTAAGQADTAHQQKLLDLKRNTELAQARTGLAKASGAHQKATRGFLAAHQSRAKQLAKGQQPQPASGAPVQALPPPGGPSAGPPSGPPPGAPPAPPAAPPAPPATPSAPPAGGGMPPAPSPAPAPGGAPAGVTVRKFSPPSPAPTPTVGTITRPSSNPDSPFATISVIGKFLLSLPSIVSR